MTSLKATSAAHQGLLHGHWRNLTQIRAPAGTRLRLSRGAVVVQAKLVLVPIGDGNTSHLEEPVSLPGEVQLEDGVFEVGREEPADIVIPVPTISGKHALLRIRGSKVQVTDLGSTNGTYVGDDELSSNETVDLPVGATIVFGDASLAAFQLEDRPEEASVGQQTPAAAEVA